MPTTEEIKVRKEKIALLKHKAETNEDVASLLRVTELYHPILLERPELANATMLRGYNRFVYANINDLELRKKLSIFEVS